MSKTLNAARHTPRLTPSASTEATLSQLSRLGTSRARHWICDCNRYETSKGIWNFKMAPRLWSTKIPRQACSVKAGHVDKNNSTPGQDALQLAIVAKGLLHNGKRSDGVLENCGQQN